MTFDIGLNEVCVRVGVRYVITKFSGMDSLPNFLHMVFRWRALRARDSSANILVTHPEWSECMNIIMTIYSTTLVSVVVFLENTHRPCPFYFYSQFDGECYEDVAVKRVSYGSFSTQMNILN